jgi:hypothetical protein
VAIPQHRLAGFEVGQRHLVALWNRLSRRDASGQKPSRANAFRIDNNPDVIPLMDADVHYSIMDESRIEERFTN